MAVRDRRGATNLQKLFNTFAIPLNFPQPTIILLYGAQNSIGIPLLFYTINKILHIKKTKFKHKDRHKRYILALTGLLLFDTLISSGLLSYSNRSVKSVRLRQIGFKARTDEAI